MSLQKRPASASALRGPCPCGLPAPYEHCCGPWHAGPQRLQAPSPQALMRSRYCAYALGLGDYLLDTWHASSRPTQPIEFDPRQRWLRLEVRGVSDAGVGVTSNPAHSTTPDQGEVEFVAISKLQGRAHRLHERSRFVREGGQWWYLDGSLYEAGEARG